MNFRKLRFLVLLATSMYAVAGEKPKLTLDSFFDSVSYPNIAISPDCNSVVIETERSDWDQKIFRHDLWLYREDGKTLLQLARSGHDSEPQWSPDGRWIAFVSERGSSSKHGKDEEEEDEGEASQVYLISPAGGEAIQLTRGEEEVHAFAWSADSRSIYFATRQPWSKEQKEAYKDKWKDVMEYRTAERGDSIFELNLSEEMTRTAGGVNHVEKKKESDTERNPDITRGARAIASTPLRVDEMCTSPDGSKLAFLSNSPNRREEKAEDAEIYLVAVGKEASRDAGQALRRLTHNQALESHLQWAADSRHIFFTVELGSVSGPYRDLQPHLYWVDSAQPENDPATAQQWGQDFFGSTEHYGQGTSLFAAGRLGTEVAMYAADKPEQSFRKISSWPGSYAAISAATHSSRVAFLYSSLQKPEEVYLADSAERLDQARPITSFNYQLAESQLPQGKTYRWKADDGTSVEGMLIYPPGKFEAKHLPMFVLIPGGPDTEGNHFEADWYQWSSLAASYGWLVFEPEYRGCTGYGEDFLMQIVPQLFTRPGKDVLEGVDALVKDDIADPERLTVGGYSYGGYLTNWVITQTTRFKAAVTGAGGVENAASWGNDDTTYDDAYFLGGRPWEAPQRYMDEAAIFHMDKVRTPTHMVAGAEDVRVPPLQSYLLEHALYSLGVPNKLLIFPGEGHSLSKNPWHGKIKVREELKWLQKYAGVPAEKLAFGEGGEPSSK